VCLKAEIGTGVEDVEMGLSPEHCCSRRRAAVSGPSGQLRHGVSSHSVKSTHTHARPVKLDGAAWPHLYVLGALDMTLLPCLLPPMPYMGSTKG
jgi:hypothetical protein